MNQSTFASRPASFLRHAFDWWLAQVKHVLPPTIFFFVGFNLILWTKRLILEEHGIEVPCREWEGRPLIRVSCQAYNDERDVERLLEALPAVLY